MMQLMLLEFNSCNYILKLFYYFNNICFNSDGTGNHYVNYLKFKN